MEKIIIFGAGNCGRLIGKQLRDEGKEVVCFIDNDPHKEGQSIALDSLSGGGARYPFIPLTKSHI